MNNAAWQLATNKDQRIRNGDLALKWAQKALQLTKGNQATYFDTLAAGYAEKGMFAEALRMVDMGLEKAEVSGDSLTKASLLKAKALYLRNRAFREE
jgi:tetratricopeptide (TPR) repeat protein